MHQNGWGTKASRTQAVYFWTVASSYGHVLAMYNLAMLHLASPCVLAYCPCTSHFLFTEMTFVLPVLLLTLPCTTSGSLRAHLHDKAGVSAMLSSCLRRVTNNVCPMQPHLCIQGDVPGGGGAAEACG